jgi:hypothetical protein
MAARCSLGDLLELQEDRDLWELVRKWDFSRGLSSRPESPASSIICVICFFYYCYIPPPIHIYISDPHINTSVIHSIHNAVALACHWHWRAARSFSLGFFLAMAAILCHFFAIWSSLLELIITASISSFLGWRLRKVYDVWGGVQLCNAQLVDGMKCWC